MKKIIVLLVVTVIAGTGFWYFSAATTAVVSQYRFVEVDQGDLESIVSSTGTLSAVTTVQVGTQVSGTIARIFVDYNQHVRRGQLVAIIDTTFLAASVRESEGNFERVKAQVLQAETDYNRIKLLHEKQFNTQSELDAAYSSLRIAEANLKSAQASLDRAHINLRHAWVYAPIDGTIIERNVDVGQTVAASLSAPVLFLIANDLAKMQILANVDESDIGQIREGQPVRFTTQAHPERNFLGTVRQIRLQPTTIQNVVNYTVVVDVDNRDGLLLPGMTATLDFLIEQAEQVLRVPNAALRFRPSADMMEEVRQRFMTQQPDSLRQRFADRGQGGGPPQGGGIRTGGAGFGGMGGGFGGGQNANASRLWYLDEEGRLNVARVRLGITNGQMTEVISADVRPGMQVISGIVAQTQASSGNPFQMGAGQQPQRRGPGPGFGGPF